ncbi:alpha/beta fold hydrolase [Micromonospora carbonacea]|uniref:alpha/beta fold hydrolase n=1 Tax=Micromonospora carbonacea TaxID=47853 RepID=UPI003D757753
MSGPADTIRTVRGRAVRCRDTGDGPPVLLLHGIGRTLAAFAELHGRLARDHRAGPWPAAPSGPCSTTGGTSPPPASARRWRWPAARTPPG